MTTQSNSDQICCPEFDPIPWDDKILQWQDKRFIKDSVCTLFYMPMNFGTVMKKLDAKIRKEGANIPDSMGLSDHTSKWNMDIYLAVDKEITDVENTTLSGKYYSKVYEGPYRDTGKWHKDFVKITESKGFKISKIYMWYTTCPKCAKKYGKNYVAIIAKID